MNKSLQETDPELFSIIQNEKKRQKDSLVLIASENFTSLSVFDALGSVMSNKYSEGYPGARYYGGNENIDKAEILCQERALKAFNLVKRIDHIIGIFIYTYTYTYIYIYL
jgi:glycine hydroxymethyltransferase